MINKLIITKVTLSLLLNTFFAFPLLANKNQDESIETITVIGEESLAFYRYEIERAENEFFTLFNQMTSEADHKVVCEKKNRHGFTRIKQRECTSGYETRIKYELTQRAINSSSLRRPVGGNGDSFLQNIPKTGEYYVAALKIRKDQLQEFREKILSSPDLQEKYIKLQEAKAKLENLKNTK